MQTASRLKQLFAPMVGKSAVCEALGHIEYAGDPNSNQTPAFSGQVCHDTSNDHWYIAKGITSTDWMRIADAGQPFSFTFAAAAGATNVANVTITPKDAGGTALTGISNLEIWLSDAGTGAGITGTTASGTVTAKSGEGTVLSALTAKKHLIGQTKAAGTFVLEITDTAKTGFYVCVANPVTGLISASDVLVTGNYG